MTLWQFFASVLAALLSALGAFYGARVAFGRYRSERLWDARYSQVTEVLDVVHRIATAAEYRRASLAHEPTRSGGSGSDGESREELARFTAIGGLLLNRKFIERLYELDFQLFMSDYMLHDELQGEEDPHRVHHARLDHAASVKAAATKAQSDLQDIAREAIGAGKPWYGKLVERPMDAYTQWKKRRVDNSDWLEPKKD